MSVVYSNSSLGQLVKLVLDNHQTEYHSLFLSVNTELKSALLGETLSVMHQPFQVVVAGICKTRQEVLCKI